jgi:hypothetical protein
MTAIDVLLERFGKGAEGDRPTRLPALSRNHLPALCKALGFTKGAEIGVWKAGYSSLFCRDAPCMHMLCVDPWLSYDAWLDGKNGPTSNIEAAYQEARAKMAGKNATIVRAFSAEAAKDVTDGSLDVAYIDGNHVLEHVLDDLALWTPKVRSGGILAGHDYRDRPDKPYIQVIRAVKAFTEAHGIARWFITAADKTPSFLWVKA